MSFVYDASVSRNIDKVRFLIGDTDELDVQLQDEEISFLLTTYSDDVSASAIQAARNLAAKFARWADHHVSEESISYSQRFKQYQALVAQLEGQVALGAGIFGGGTAISGIGGEDPAFTRSLHEVSTVNQRLRNP